MSKHTSITRLLVLALCALQPLSRARGEAPGSAPPAEPAANPSQPPEAASGSASADDRAQKRAAIDAELSQILDELVEARARAAFLGKRLFDTQLVIHVSRDADAQALSHLRIALDGAPIHDSDGQALARGEAQIFEGPVAEGMHELSVEVSEHAKADAAFETVRSERFKLKVRRKHRTELTLELRDSSDLAEETAEGDDGDLDVRTRLHVKSREVKPR
jgi:flagellin-like hook-associated protein FlgL